MQAGFGWQTAELMSSTSKAVVAADKLTCAGAGISGMLLAAGAAGIELQAAKVASSKAETVAQAIRFWIMMSTPLVVMHCARRRTARLRLAARISFSGNAYPDRVFFLLGHEHPVRDFRHSTPATAANIIKSGGANGNARGIGTLRRVL